MQDFFAHTPNWSQEGIGKQVVLYDTAALSAPQGDIVSITFDFFDGSTLSLVGLSATAPHWLAA